MNSRASALRTIASKPDGVKMLIMWSFLVGVMILGGYAVYYQTLGVGVPYQNSPIEAALASMLFVFGIYLLGLVLHGYLFSQK